MNRLNKAFADALSDARESAGMSIASLAKATGIPLRTLNRVLKGETDINVSHIYLIATALGITTDDIVDKAGLHLTQAALNALDDE